MLSIDLLNPGIPIICSSATGALGKENPFNKSQAMMTDSFGSDMLGFGRQTIADLLMPAKVMAEKKS